jgi:hypothetical protein
MMVVVALVGHYMLPDASELPRSLRPLTRRGIVNMGAVESFDHDQHYLNEAVRKMLDGSARKAVRTVILVFAAIMIAALAFTVFATIATNTPK